jgi:hypothetical protein
VTTVGVVEFCLGTAFGLFLAVVFYLRVRDE